MPGSTASRSRGIWWWAVEHRPGAPAPVPWLLLLVFLISLPAVTTRIYASDEIQYFAYLRSLWFDRDVSFENEYQHFYAAGIARAQNFHETFLERTTETGRRINFAHDRLRSAVGARSTRRPMQGCRWPTWRARGSPAMATRGRTSRPSPTRRPSTGCSRCCCRRRRSGCSPDIGARWARAPCRRPCSCGSARRCCSTCTSRRRCRMRPPRLPSRCSS